MFSFIKNIFNRTIHKACKNGNIKAVKRFLADGTDVHVKNDDGYTPLWIAAGWGHKEIAELLISKGANVNSLNEDKGTPLDLISPKELEGVTAEIAILLRKHGGKTADELRAAGN